MPLSYRSIIRTSRENSTSEPLISILIVVACSACVYGDKVRSTLRWIAKATNSACPVTYASKHATGLRLTGSRLLGKAAFAR